VNRSSVAGRTSTPSTPPRALARCRRGCETSGNHLFRNAVSAYPAAPSAAGRHSVIRRLRRSAGRCRPQAQRRRPVHQGAGSPIRTFHPRLLADRRRSCRAARPGPSRSQTWLPSFGGAWGLPRAPPDHRRGDGLLTSPAVAEWDPHRDSFRLQDG
jgi:hypothetical protein